MDKSAAQKRAKADFYDETRAPQPSIRVCNGEACRAAGADALKASLPGAGDVTCLGLCSQGPNHSINGKVVGDKENPIYGGEPSVVLSKPEGKAPAISPQDLIEMITASGLQGRGGAGFPMGRKLATVASHPGPRYVVANLDEGDAGAYIDKELAERFPETLIEGLMISAHACGAEEAFIYIRAEYPDAYAALEKAKGNLPITLVRGKGAYVCGEETSLLRSIEGLPGQVSTRPPYPAESGLWGQPTAVNNVETLCNLPWIVRNGAEAYAALGTEQSKGTKLVSLNTRVKRPGLYEVEMGTTIREILFDLADGMADGHTFQAMQVGGPLGAILPEAALDAPFSFEGLEAAGGILGHGGIVVFSDQDDLMSMGRGLMAFCARESCGKCFPCCIGTARGVELLDQIIDGGLTTEREELLLDLCETLKLGSLCGLGGMAPTPILSLLQHFPELWGKTP